MMEQTFTEEQIANGELKNLFDYLLGFNANTVSDVFMDISAKTVCGITSVRWEAVHYDMPGVIPVLATPIKDPNDLLRLSSVSRSLPFTDCIVVGLDMVPLLKSCPDFDYDENSKPREGKAIVIGKWNHGGLSYTVCVRDEAEGEMWFLRKGGYMLHKLDLKGRI